MKTACALLFSGFVAFASATAVAEPARESCLGPTEALLTCASGTELVDLRDADGGAAFCATRRGVDHWPPASRNGPSIWYQYANPRRVDRAGRYKDHKKHGRHYNFDDQGRLETIIDWQNDDFHGLYVTCHDNGSVESVMRFERGTIVGFVRRWDDKGRARTVSRYENGDYVETLHDGSQDKPAPKDLCRPTRCDLDVPVGTGAL